MSILQASPSDYLTPVLPSNHTQIYFLGVLVFTDAMADKNSYLSWLGYVFFYIDIRLNCRVVREIKHTFIIMFSTLLWSPHHLNSTVTSLYAHIIGSAVSCSKKKEIWIYFQSLFMIRKGKQMSNKTGMFLTNLQSEKKKKM